MLLFLPIHAAGPQATTYVKAEYDIPMRDGIKLHTVVYSPKNVAGAHPILMERTPYGAGPYGTDFRSFRGSAKMREAGYIFAWQDVRGQGMSEGEFVNIRPQLEKGAKGADESTDTYDTVDWLVKNVPDNNGAVGLWGISYPGFYAGVGAIGTHPNLKAVSPQAPVSDWFKGDDVHHNGAFFLQDNFNFVSGFDVPRGGQRPAIEKAGGEYDFFLKGGSSEALEAKYLKGLVPYWNELIDHPNYDAYWKARSLPDHMKGIKCAVLTVGGWFDAEDMWGALNVYAQTERQNKNPNFLVMGPWYHGMWSRTPGNTFGDLDFGGDTSQYFQDQVEFPFFERYLRGQKGVPMPEATMFETGTNRWRLFPHWPPEGLQKVRRYLTANKGLAARKSTGSDAFAYDPAAPTPYLPDYETSRGRPREYMIADQRWNAQRADVLTFTEAPLKEDLTVAGPIEIDFWVTTTGTDLDLVVKAIDVYPDDAPERTPAGAPMTGYQLNLKADVFRGRFRNSLERPEPFVPGQPTRVRFKLNDVLHTFRKGHRLMIQVQGAWFPLVDRNPNRFVPNIHRAKPEDYQKATITVLHDSEHPSSVGLGMLN